MQLVASVAVLVIGLLIAFVLKAAADLRIFGWLLIVVGLLGLASRVLLARLQARRDSPPPQR